MPRLGPVIACLCLAGCSATEARPKPAFRAPSDSLVAPQPLPAPAGETALPTEAELRERVARAANPSLPALQLVSILDAEERQREALEVVDRALERAPGDAALTVARAGLLRDLGRRHDAAGVLAGLLVLEGAERMHPGLLCELAELQLLEGDCAAAQATLSSLRHAHGGSAWMQSSGARVAAAERAAAAGRPERMSARDLLGNLRGAPHAADRLAALSTLVALGGELAARAVAIAGADGEAAVRARAVELAVVDADALAEVVALGLADRAPEVRCAAARRAGIMPRADAVELLLPALAAEQESAPFAALQEALLRQDRDGPTVSADRIRDPMARSELVQAWRQRWGK